MSDEIQHPEESPKNDSAPLFVSLYVVLLAFFIMLNTMASVDHEKMEDAVSSIKHTFNYRTDLEPVVADVTPGVGTEISLTQFFAGVRRVAESYIPLDQLEITSNNNTMFIRFPQSSIYMPEDASLRDSNNLLFSDLADIIKVWQPGLRVDIEYLVGYTPNLYAPSSEDTRLAIERAGAFARAMASREVYAKQLAPGLQQTHPDDVTLIFRVRSLDASQLNLSAPATPRSAPASTDETFVDPAPGIEEFVDE